MLMIFRLKAFSGKFESTTPFGAHLSELPNSALLEHKSNLDWLEIIYNIA